LSEAKSCIAEGENYDKIKQAEYQYNTKLKLMRFKIFLPVLLISFMTITGNIFARKLSKINIAQLYEEYNFSSLQAVIYHKWDSISQVYVSINPDDFRFLANQNHTIIQANIEVRYELYQSYESSEILDSATIKVTDTSSYGKGLEMIIDFEVKARFPGNYVLKIIVTDLNIAQDNEIFRLFDLSKSNKNSRQYFLVTDNDGYPVFNNFIVPGQYFHILYNDTSVHKLYIRYYNQTFPLAKPPFANVKDITYTFKPDSILSTYLTEGYSPLLELPNKGIYHIQPDLTKPDGLTLFNFDDGFPEIATPASAIAPLRYLTTSKEYDKLLSYANYKTAIDSFWLERSSNQQERAKSMIKKYYSRVQYSNKIFSSFVEGWKTDRGLIYIIYGPPTEVYRKDDEEKWIYGKAGNPLSIIFYFYKVDNPLTENDYSLSRSPSHKKSWYIAIDNWRR
jgi:GWxTD domain-containing protein